jgi:hypothetical protein
MLALGFAVLASTRTKNPVLFEHREVQTHRIQAKFHQLQHITGRNTHRDSPQAKFSGMVAYPSAENQ